MHNLTLFLPTAAGVEDLLLNEVRSILGASASNISKQRGGVQLQGSWQDMMQLNLHSRLAQRVLIALHTAPYHNEDDIYQAAGNIAWQDWFRPEQTFKVDITAQRSPLKSLNFALLRVKDAVVDYFRNRHGQRPSIDTANPNARIHIHLTQDTLTLYIDTSGQPLFKRGWRKHTGDAPLKETLAAAMLAASNWAADTTQPLVDPCCGSGTLVIEAAQIACNMAAGIQRTFAFEQLLPHQTDNWQKLRQAARAQVRTLKKPIAFGSDVSHRMVDFAQRNAQCAGVAHAVQFRGGDALQRTPPIEQTGVLILNPPYGSRIGTAGFAGQKAAHRARQQPQTTHADTQFFQQLARHWKQHYGGWTAWILSPDMKLPNHMRLQASRRVPLWNGAIECRLFRFDILQPKASTQAPNA